MDQFVASALALRKPTTRELETLRGLIEQRERRDAEAREAPATDGARSDDDLASEPTR